MDIRASITPGEDYTEETVTIHREEAERLGIVDHYAVTPEGLWKLVECCWELIAAPDEDDDAD